MLKFEIKVNKVSYTKVLNYLIQKKPTVRSHIL